MNRYPLFPALCLILALLSFLITIQGHGDNAHANIQVAIAPSIAKATINGHGAKIGNNSVKKPGKYTVKAYADGFASKSQTVSVKQGQNIYVGLALQSNSSATKNWYSQHPSDQSLSDAIGSHESNNYDKTALSNNPFLKQLPLSYSDGNGGFINISQGVSLEPNGPPAVYVDAATPADRQNVLEYMRSRGYDPAVMDMVFYQVNIPFGDEGE